MTTTPEPAKDDLPSRVDIQAAIKRFVDSEPEVAFNLHPDLEVILDAADRYAEGLPEASDPFAGIVDVKHNDPGDAS